MVTINFTIVVQLVLFLIFLWGLRAFVLGPVLKEMDDRDHYIEQQESRAKVDEDLAVAQETRYANALREAHQEAEERFRDARRALLEEQQEILARQREQAERAVAIARDDSIRRAQEQRAQFREVVPKLADTIAERAGLELPGS